MKVSIFGIGYVGMVTAGCLAKLGHKIICVDVLEDKVNQVNQGKSPIYENGLGELVQRYVKKKAISATTNGVEAVQNTDLSIICVGTPSDFEGSIDLSYLKSVSDVIGEGLKNKKQPHIIVCRSSIVPGTSETTTIPTIEAISGKRHGEDFSVFMYPEFLREGMAISDFQKPAHVIIGWVTEFQRERIKELMPEHISKEVIYVPIKMAEMIKYADNTWHALKVAFANEIGNICKTMDVDSIKFMELFKMDTKLNISPYYLTPGFAYGGSCLPKDLRALTALAKQKRVTTPILNSISESNHKHIEKACNLILSKETKNISLLGLSFKAETPDLRESPSISLIKLLEAANVNVRFFDPHINLNDAYLNTALPNAKKIACKNVDELMAHSKTIVICTQMTTLQEVLRKTASTNVIIDLVHATSKDELNCNYINLN